MKAIVQDTYGSPSVLQLCEVPAPRPGDGEVLVEVHAATVNARDWHVMRGDPYLARLDLGIRHPKVRIRGTDFAGRVTVGRPGRDEVPPRRRGVRRGRGSLRRVRVRAGGRAGVQAGQRDFPAGRRPAAGREHRAGRACATGG